MNKSCVKKKRSKTNKNKKTEADPQYLVLCVTVHKTNLNFQEQTIIVKIATNST